MIKIDNEKLDQFLKDFLLPWKALKRTYFHVFIAWLIKVLLNLMILGNTLARQPNVLDRTQCTRLIKIPVNFLNAEVFD